MELEAQSRRVLVADAGEWLLSQISGDHPGQRSADYTRTELTRRFAANPGRQGALTVSRLYGEILPPAHGEGPLPHPLQGGQMHHRHLPVGVTCRYTPPQKMWKLRKLPPPRRVRGAAACQCQSE